MAIPVFPLLRVARVPWSAICWALGGLLLIGCAAPVPRTTTPSVSGSRIPVPGYVRAVRRAVRASDGAETMRLLRSEEPLDPRDPERAYLLVMLWPAWCGSEQARTASRALPAGDLGAALRALTDEHPDRALRRLQALRRGCATGWRDLAKARLHARLGDMPASIGACALALRSQRDFVRHEAHVLRAALLLEEGRIEDAARDARAAAALDPEDARPARFLARVHRAAGRRDQAADALIDAIRIAPESESYAHRLGETLREGVSPAVWQRVDAAVPRLAAEYPRNAELRTVQGMAAEHADRPAEAIEHYRAALASGADPVPLDRDLRCLLMQAGAYAEGVGMLVSAVPPDVIADPQNLLHDRWVALHSAVGGAPSGAAAPEERLRLARALVGLGALPEALHVLNGLQVSDARDLATRVQGQVAFEEGLREWLEGGFRTASRKEDPANFGAGLRALRDLANEHLVPDERAAFANPSQGLRSIPILGAWLDHSTHSCSPAVVHFRKYGHYLLFGQHTDAPPEAIVFSLASLTASQPIRTGGRLYRHDVAIGYDRVLRSFISSEGGEMGGACLADGLWLDADAARSTDHGIRRRLGYDPYYAACVRASGALAADTLEGPLALSDPGSTAARLVARYAARHPEAYWGSFGTLRAHESGHVRDIRRHLPILRGLPATIGLALRNGLSIDRAQMELERRAQLAACMDAADPDLALAEMLAALPVTAREPEVHDGGYRSALQSIVLHVQDRPDLYPQIDRTKRVLTQLDRLSNDQIRQAARAVACR